jgi:DNA-binding PadR family transcriptional regulator
MYVEIIVLSQICSEPEYGYEIKKYKQDFGRVKNEEGQ